MRTGSLSVWTVETTDGIEGRPWRLSSTLSNEPFLVPWALRTDAFNSGPPYARAASPSAGRAV
jgi:hypothetical protein